MNDDRGLGEAMGVKRWVRIHAGLPCRLGRRDLSDWPTLMCLRGNIQGPAGQVGGDLKIFRETPINRSNGGKLWEFLRFGKPNFQAGCD